MLGVGRTYSCLGATGLACCEVGIVLIVRRFDPGDVGAVAALLIYGTGAAWLGWSMEMTVEDEETLSVQAVKDGRGRWCVVLTVAGNPYPPILCRNESHARAEVRMWENRLRRSDRPKPIQ